MDCAGTIHRLAGKWGSAPWRGCADIAVSALQGVPGGGTTEWCFSSKVIDEEVDAGRTYTESSRSCLTTKTILETFVSFSLVVVAASSFEVFVSNAAGLREEEEGESSFAGKDRDDVVVKSTVVTDKEGKSKKR
mmetsp:Transcript_6912/g.13677  ORF Transcript_6912/g.13677 Transcript_6912/m.13677 type:complete len:134 (+) Transcript_6912:462-863(+)